MEKVLRRSSYHRSGNLKIEKRTVSMNVTFLRTRRSIVTLNIAMVLLCLTMASCYLISGLYARYTSEATGNDRARAASYVFNVTGGSGEFSLNDLQVGYPGTSDSHDFSVSNYSGESVCEMDQKITVTLSYEGDLPLKITLKDTTNNKDLIVLGADEVTYSAEGSSDFTFEAGEKISRNLSVIAEWPAKRNDLTYSAGGKTCCVNVKIRSEQID